MKFQRQVQTTYTEEKNLTTPRSLKIPIERTGSSKGFECFDFACCPWSFSTANLEHHRFFPFTTESPGRGSEVVSHLSGCIAVVPRSPAGVQC